MPRTDRLLIIVAVIAVLFGSIVRVYPFGGFAKVGFDEHIYQTYVDRLSHGVSYPELIGSYIEAQTATPAAFLPPTRVTFLSAAAIWRNITGQDSIHALRAVALAFGLLTVFVAGAFAWRAGGLRVGCGVLILMSAAPLQIHLSHRALVDGVFAFWTLLCLWMLWETLRQPRNWRWLAGYGGALALLVMTKENAAFVYVAILALLALNRWIKFGQISSPLLIATIAAPAVAVVVLILLSGGAEPFFHTYLLNIQKSYVLDYAIKTGDGPWYRYLLDLFALSPLLMLLACGGLWLTRREDRWEIFLVVFVVVTYVVMANLRYGMNVRYGAIWDFPLRCFALAQLTVLALAFSERLRAYILPGMLAFVAAVDFRQDSVLFVTGGIYDPIPRELLRAVGILK